MRLRTIIFFAIVYMVNISAASAQDMELVSRELDRYSQEDQSPPANSYSTKTPDRKAHTFEMALETYNYKYQETVNGGKFMGNRGQYNGLFGAYTFRPRDVDSFFDEIFANMFRFEVRYALGKVDYTGSGNYYGLKDYSYEVRAILGREYYWGESWQFVPYSGVGFRYLNDGLQAYTPGGYNRESRYLYMPIGFTVHKNLRNAWGIGFNAEYDIFLGGKQISHEEDVDPGYSPVSNTQRRGFGARGSLKIEKEIPDMKFCVEPFFRYWHIQDSDAAPEMYQGVPTGWALLEPENTTQEFGIKMGVEF
jgi:hypothetical protein